LFVIWRYTRRKTGHFPSLGTQRSIWRHLWILIREQLFYKYYEELAESREAQFARTRKKATRKRRRKWKNLMAGVFIFTSGEFNFIARTNYITPQPIPRKRELLINA